MHMMTDLYQASRAIYINKFHIKKKIFANNKKSLIGTEETHIHQNIFCQAATAKQNGSLDVPKI